MIARPTLVPHEPLQAAVLVVSVVAEMNRPRVLVQLMPHAHANLRAAGITFDRRDAGDEREMRPVRRDVRERAFVTPQVRLAPRSDDLHARPVRPRRNLTRRRLSQLHHPHRRPRRAGREQQKRSERHEMSTHSHASTPPADRTGIIPTAGIAATLITTYRPSRTCQSRIAPAELHSKCISLAPRPCNHGRGRLRVAAARRVLKRGASPNPQRATAT